MSAREALQVIVRARREGVTLFAKADGKLGLKADRPPSDELLAVLKEHKAEILALLVPPARTFLPSPCASLAVERAKRTIWQLRSFGFRPRLDAEGALLIVDAYATGKKRRDVSQRLPIAEVFDQLVAGLADDPGLLDEVVREPARSVPYAARGAFQASRTPPAKAGQPKVMIMAKSETMTIQEQAQRALTTLNCAHPDTGVTELQGVLARLDPNSPDAEVFKRAINRLNEIAYEIGDVESSLAEASFSFGKIEA